MLLEMLLHKGQLVCSRQSEWEMLFQSSSGTNYLLSSRLQLLEDFCCFLFHFLFLFVVLKRPNQPR